MKQEDTDRIVSVLDRFGIPKEKQATLLTQLRSAIGTAATSNNVGYPIVFNATILSLEKKSV